MIDHYWSADGVTLVTESLDGMSGMVCVRHWDISKLVGFKMRLLEGYMFYGSVEVCSCIFSIGC